MIGIRQYHPNVAAQRLASPMQASPRQMPVRVISSPRPTAGRESYGPGVEVQIGEHSFRCSRVLGRGSYGEVWKAQVLSGSVGFGEVALKEVCCRSQSELQQAIFEVQVLLALERATRHPASLRVPRCISYTVDPSDKGWKVRTAMTVVPGESLDFFVRRKPVPEWTMLMGMKRGLILVAKLLKDIGPSLQLLGPIAWHRDVNSHNILVNEAPDDIDEASLAQHAGFWLIDFGLAVDSQSWVSETGKWRTEYIGGDSRYWPPSSWIMHLMGPEGFANRPDLCEQYQRRLDVHGLGVTALELLCSVALRGSPVSEEQLGPWSPVLAAWTRYRDEVWRWWAAVYEVFSSGGDLAPVQARLMDENIIDQVLELVAQIRHALRSCAEKVEKHEALLLSMIADMLDEGKSFDLADIPRLLGPSTASPIPAAPWRSASQHLLGSSPSLSKWTNVSTVQRRFSDGWHGQVGEVRRAQRSTSAPSNARHILRAASNQERVLVVTHATAAPPPLQSQPAGCLSAPKLPWNGVPLPTTAALKASSSGPGQAKSCSRKPDRSNANEDELVNDALPGEEPSPESAALAARMKSFRAKCLDTSHLDQQLALLEERFASMLQSSVEKAKVRVSELVHSTGEESH
eukprot:TRINITY_DN5349_c0_g2_i1.p1 TRINITY_DN5349_c0_g2~~TRINITY_DN5349_c0_g2_i1.p1  ORF type:complete len:630 (+),score=113.90 TRINITY_DN5349_c0_g2_i1:172-2061(+)